ncbi:MAG TPA: hypothetical protein VM285_13625 [Polyangia bacterium]|nr:hypothetical protein [Polyangia bacterium]
MNGTPLHLLASLVAVATLAATSCGDSGGRPAKDGVAGARAQAPSTKDLISGRWRMTGEEPADGKGGFFKQERRLLELMADGTYHVENYVTAWDDTWALEGDVLVLRKLRVVGGDIVTAIPDPERPGEMTVIPTGLPREELDETARVGVERVDADTLVLVEDLPGIYAGEGPPRKVRNTYRRVSESELGPMLGEPLKTSAPVAGLYAGAYEYGMSKYPTMEITITHSVRGRARLELAADGTAAGCFGVASVEHFSESEYSSRDGKSHRERREERSLFAARGRWAVVDGRGLVKLDRFWRETCDTSAGEGDVMGPLELECTAIEPTDRLPVPTLGCLLARYHGHLDALAVNPADTERAGPYVMQLEPMGHISPDPGRPWLFLGAAPGLEVKSEDDRSARTPRVTFNAAEVDFDEGDYGREQKTD